MKAPKMNVIDRFVLLLSLCIACAAVMVFVIDDTSQYWAITYFTMMAVVVLNCLYLLLRMMLDLSLLKPTKLFARFSHGLGILKRLDTITRVWVIGILALCLLSIGFVFYVSFQNAAGVMPYAIVTGVFTVIGIVFLYVIGQKTD